MPWKYCRTTCWNVCHFFDTVASGSSFCATLYLDSAWWCLFSLSFLSSAVTSRFMTFLTSPVYGWYSTWGAVVACLHRRMVRVHTHSLMYHVFVRVISCYLSCSFIFLSVLLYGRSFLFSRQPASDADSTCLACYQLPGYSYLVVAPW